MSEAPAYDTVAELYSELFLHDLDRVTFDRDVLDAFVAGLGGEAPVYKSVVLDVGCGPGHVTDYLRRAGVHVVGSDLSIEMIRQANRHFPDGQHLVGDFASLPHPVSSIGGIVSRYSVIHLPPESLALVFEEWARVLAPGAPLMLSGFAADRQDHGQPFDHKVATAHQLCPEVLVEQLAEVQFCETSVSMRGPLSDEPRQMRHFAVAARLGSEAN